MRAVVLLLLCCAVSALSLTEDAKESKPAATVAPAQAFDSKPTTPAPPPPKPTTAAPPPPKPTTPAPPPPKPTTAAPPPPKPTTAAPPPPKPTTAAPPPPKNTTTTPPKNTTTTAAPPKNTTTTAPPPPPKPTPPTNLTTGNYTLMKDNRICLMAVVALQLRLQTPKDNGTFIIQPNQTQTYGSCKDTTANLTLVFKQGFITFIFVKNDTSNDVYVDALSFTLSYPFSKAGNADYRADNTSVHRFVAKIGHCYSCTGESLYMGNGLYLDVSQDRMQAFNLTKSNDFGPSDRCPADQSDYRVAIGVGVTLLVLIVVVVVVYLLGRRRRSDGYQSL